jgi:hypothetical protein
LHWLEQSTISRGMFDINWTETLGMTPEVTPYNLIDEEEFFRLTKCQFKKDTDKVKFIGAFTGDDACHFTNSMEFVRNMISIEKDMDIQISEKDTGISYDLGNFAEEWILTPLTSEMSWEDTNSIHKSEGLPWAFDSVKLKSASSIRKGGTDSEANSFDKISDLSQRASWAVRGWLTYHDHQLLSILGKCTLDISDGPYSPLLYPTEGGSGTVAEWGNLLNLIGLLGRYCQKKTDIGTYIIMKESNMINKGLIKPENCYSTKLLHLSQVEFSTWKKFSGLLKFHKSLGYRSELEVWEQLSDMAGEPLPIELTEKSVVIKSESFVEGTVISRLRNLGLIMTELDVRLALNQRERYSATVQNRNVGTFIRSLQEKKEKIKARPLNIFRSLANKRVPSFDVVVDRKSIYFDFLDVMQDYIANRVSSVLPYTAFSYRSEIRLFRSIDVLSSFPGRELGTLRKMMRGESVPWIPFGTYDEGEEEKFRLLERWVNNTDITELFEKLLPLGATTDDARLYSDLTKVKNISKDIHILNIIVTDDIRLFRALVNLSEVNFVIRRISVKDYVSLCLAARKGGKYKEHYRNEFFSVLDRRTYRLPDKTSWGNSSLSIMHYDVPNIEKSIVNMKFNGVGVTKESSGYIPVKQVLLAEQSGRNYFLQPINKVKRLIRRPAEMVLLPEVENISPRW